MSITPSPEPREQAVHAVGQVPALLNEMHTGPRGLLNVPVPPSVEGQGAGSVGARDSQPVNKQRDVELMNPRCWAALLTIQQRETKRLLFAPHEAKRQAERLR